jgi:hypothetical protein
MPVMSPEHSLTPSRLKQSRCNPKRVEMLFAHLKRNKAWALRSRGPRGAQDEFTLGAIAQNLAGLRS